MHLLSLYTGTTSFGNASFQRERILNDQISVSSPAAAATINLNFKVIT